MTPTEMLRTAEALGLELPTPAYISGAVLFGLIGLAAWRIGRRQERPRTLWLGVALMLYPYLVSGTAWLFAIGTALCLGLWLDRG